MGTVNVRVAAVNIDDRKIDFVLTEQIAGPGKGAGRPGGGRGRGGRGGDRRAPKHGKSPKTDKEDRGKRASKPGATEKSKNRGKKRRGG